jgi:hypothetical protein
MRTLAGGLGLFARGTFFVAVGLFTAYDFTACSGSAGQLFTSVGGAPGAAGFTGIAGRGGRGGVSGRAGRGGLGGQAGLEGGRGGGAGDSAVPDDGGANTPDAEGECSDDGACDDGNDCTANLCESGRCSHPALGAGVECGVDQAGDCTAAASCDGAGACVASAAPNGASCEGGSCTLGECIQGQPVGCPAEVVSTLPFQASWRTVGGVNLFDPDGGCDAVSTPDFAVVFTAPAAALYRFAAAGEVGTNDPESQDPDASERADSVLTIASGACGGLGATQLACNDDINDNSRDSGISLRLEAGQTVTVYASEYHERVPGGGSGTLSIALGD